MAAAFQVTGAFEGTGTFAFQGAAAVTATHYGVTAGGHGLSAVDGVVLLNAHGVGGNQKNNDGVEGIPLDAPQ